MQGSIKQNLKRNWLWFFYIVFVVIAVSNHQGEPLLFSDGPYGAGKIITWIILMLFLAYSLRVSAKENFFRSLVKMNPILWSRQIGLDLYIGLLVPLFLIYLNEGSMAVLALWFLPIFVFANLATLLYLAMNYDSLIAHFIS